jgi:hypothetical protein
MNRLLYVVGRQPGERANLVEPLVILVPGEPVQSVGFDRPGLAGAAMPTEIFTEDIVYST